MKKETEIDSLRKSSLMWWNNELTQEQRDFHFSGYEKFTPAKHSSELTGREIQNIWAVNQNPPTPVKETEPEQPYYKGKGEHSVNQLEAICSQYKEYVSFLNSRGNDTTPTSKEGLEDRGFTKGEWVIESTPNDGDTSHIICSDDKETTIAGIYKWPVEGYHKEAEANARLIAAAPAMYKALKKASKLIYDMKDKYCMKDGFLKDNALFDAETELEIEAILTRINKD